MTETVKTIGATFGILTPVIAFIYWHFKSVNSFKKKYLKPKHLNTNKTLFNEIIHCLRHLVVNLTIVPNDIP